jgi:hypothetical protein
LQQLYFLSIHKYSAFLILQLFFSGFLYFAVMFFTSSFFLPTVSVVEPHHLYAAPDPALGEHFDSAPAATI